MAEIKVNTGAVRYAIKDEFGDEIGVIKFNPGDVDIIRRYKEVSDYFKDFKISENVTPEEFFNLTDEIKKKFDYLLNTNTSSCIFGVANPLTPTGNGKIYAVNVLEAVDKIMSETLKKRTAKLNTALEDIVG